MISFRIVPCSVLSGVGAQIESKHGAVLLCWKMHVVCSSAVYSFPASEIDTVSKITLFVAK